MKPFRKKKLTVLLSILAMVTLLGGCVSNPDSTDKNSTAGAGYNGDLPWDVLATIAPIDLTGTPQIDLVTTPQPSGEIIFPGIDFPTGGIPGLVTLTPMPFTPGIATQLPTLTPTLVPQATAAPLVLKLGSTGIEVRNLQAKLRDLGYMRTVDGDFGDGTKRALISFQNRNGLLADGMACPATLAKLSSRNAVRAPLTPKPTQVPLKATATPQINENIILELGSRGADVRRMQSRLIALGYLAGSPTGVFNEATEAAVIAFQKRNVSYYDGKAGPLTLNKLYSSSAKGTSSIAGAVGVTLKIGDKNSDAVRAMQRRLKDLGYYIGAIDGDFGASTEAAVRSFQSTNRLNVDGKAGDTTLNLLNSNNAKRADYSSFTQRPGQQITPLPQYTPITVFTNVTPSPDGNYVTLRPGNMGTLVTNLQQGLRTKGYYRGDVDGKYGTGTIDAVTRFQADNGLSQDGVAGPSTQRVLFEGNFPVGS